MALVDDCTNYWKLDESSGDAIDSAGSDDGTVTGATQGVTGKINDCYSFDGSGDYITIGNGGIISNESISVWVKHTSNARGKVVALHTNNGSSRSGWCISNHENGMAILLEGVAFGTFATGLNDGAWHHLVATKNGSTYNMYADGNSTPVSTLTNAGGTFSTTTLVGAGSATSITDFFTGSIDEIGIFDKTLSTSEVSELYNSGDGLAYPFGEAPTAAFSGTPLTGKGLITTTFTDESTNTPTSWLWDFGDGDSSTDQNPVHEYRIGTFTVSLTATNDDGSDEEIKEDYITVTRPPSSTVDVGSGTIGTKEVANIYPIEEGLIAGTTRQTGNPNLVATEEGTW